MSAAARLRTLQRLGVGEHLTAMSTDGSNCKPLGSCLVRKRGLDRSAQASFVDGSAVLHPVDKERRRGADTAANARVEVGLDSLQPRLLSDVGLEAIRVEAKRLRVGTEVIVAKRMLVGEQTVVHGPESALSGS